MAKTTPNVAYVREELQAMMPVYKTISDCVAGQLAVKTAGDLYLPRPNAEDTSQANKLRYENYLKRAVFYGATRRTLTGLVGQIFSRDPVIEVPVKLEPVRDDADGAGVNIVQQAKKTTSLCIKHGRAGLFVDYPTVDEPVSLKAQIDGDIRPTIFVYEAKDIINWRTISRGGKEVLSLVVLVEDIDDEDDGFETTKKRQYRVLRLSPTSEYYAEIWSIEINEKKERESVLQKTLNPRDAEGKPFTEIPFTFVGSQNNDAEIDDAPMSDLANLNIAHYRNSADYEESSFMVGQPTPVITGLTEDWVTNVLKGKVHLGSRAAILLPDAGSADLLQAAPNSMPKEAMELKERQMVAIGAKLIESKTVERTATEVVDDATTANSTLATSAKNVSAAYTLALQWCNKFVGSIGDEKLKFELNNDFILTRLTSEERRQLLAEWQGGGIAFEEMREQLRRGGIAYLDDEAAKETIKNELSDIPGLEVNVDNNVKPAGNGTAKKPAAKPKAKKPNAAK